MSSSYYTKLLPTGREHKLDLENIHYVIKTLLEYPDQFLDTDQIFSFLKIPLYKKNKPNYGDIIRRIKDDTGLRPFITVVRRKGILLDTAKVQAWLKEHPMPEDQ